jgi:putative ABC transport system permease protein
MFGYYFNLALRSFRRDKALTALMVLAIALGIGACMTTLTVFHVLSGDPIPDKSDRLFYVQLDAESMNDYTPGQEPNEQVTRYDAEALLREKRGARQALMTGGGISITPDQEGLVPFTSDARYTSADFFPMFDVPMLHGNGWSAREDADRARVAVISRSLNDRVFGGGNSVGKQLRIDQSDFTVVGVVDEWRPTPRFYDMNSDRYGQLEDVFLPFSTSRDLDMGRNGSMNCWGDSGGDSTGVNAPCTWIQYWVELESADKAAAYRDYLVNYSDQQRAAGRFKRPTNVRLRNVMEWLEYARVVPRDVMMQLWLGLGFLLVCLVNTVGLLLAKFSARPGEIGVRRALGATRREVFKQYLTEAGVIGLVGATVGVAMTFGALAYIRHFDADIAQITYVDGTMLATAIALSIVASLLAGLLPTWRACQVVPALQLKSQ